MFDGQVVRPPASFREVASDYVCIRIVNINDFDLNLFPFDHDLTLAIVLANADGTVYHRYGGRDYISPMNMETVVNLMKEGLETHQTYERQPSPPHVKPALTLSQLIEKRLPGRIKATFGCYHCHYAREASQILAAETSDWTPDQFWIWPAPDRIVLEMDQRQQNQVLEVVPGSAAEEAGFRPWDFLQGLDNRRIPTKYDIQWILQQHSEEASQLDFERRRDREVQTGHLKLGDAWKVGDPADYLWRVRNVFTEHMIKFLPAPGFVGEAVTGHERATMGLPESTLALRITHLNHGTYKAGIRLGDIVLSVSERSDFDTLRDFYHWCEVLRRSGRDLKMEIVRQGALMNVMVGLEHLNDPHIAETPRVVLGFIAQELAGNRGLRVGHVTEDSSAAGAGLQHDDRIDSVDGQAVQTLKALNALLNNKAPGDVLTLSVQRDGQPLNFGYVLSGEQEQISDLANLNDTVKQKGQRLACVVTIRLPDGDHIYSVHKKGFGLPTQLEFRGHGYQLVGRIEEPPPKAIAEPGVETMWILEGDVRLKQVIEVTDPHQFQLLLRVYAQVCDEKRCYEFRSTIVNDGRHQYFKEYHGRFDDTNRLDRSLRLIRD